MANTIRYRLYQRNPQPSPFRGGSPPAGGEGYPYSTPNAAHIPTAALPPELGGRGCGTTPPPSPRYPASRPDNDRTVVLRRGHRDDPGEEDDHVCEDTEIVRGQAGAECAPGEVADERDRQPDDQRGERRRRELPARCQQRQRAGVRRDEVDREIGVKGARGEAGAGQQDRGRYAVERRGRAKDPAEQPGDEWRAGKVAVAVDGGRSRPARRRR